MQECSRVCKKAHNESVTHYFENAPLAMGYVPWQRFHGTFEPCKALHNGTIFPELCLPFCGRRCGR
jgi:hypothetical protein